MAMLTILKRNRGLTLIELMVALVISAILITAIYRTFIRQQKTYTVQEQVVDMQQNARVSISRMMDEIRMAGFGNISTVLPVSFGGRSFANIINLNTPTARALTIISAIGESAVITGIPSQNQIVLSRLADDQGQPLFDIGDRRYISVGGLESYMISAIDTDTKTVTLNSHLKYNHVANRTLVFGIRAITYKVENDGGVFTLLDRDENMGEGPQPLADNIEDIQFEYLDAAGNPVANPPDIRIIRVMMTARTNRPDPELKDGDGHRRRQIASNIYLRNMAVSP